MTAFSNTFRFFFIQYIVVLQPQYCLNNIGLGSFAFARHYLRNHYYFLLLRVMRCFSSPRSPPIKGYHAFNMVGCPIRKSSDQRSFAPPRSLSQLITSFIACESLGIHRTPFLTSYRLSYRVICADYAESVLSFFIWTAESSAAAFASWNLMTNHFVLG